MRRLLTLPNLVLAVAAAIIFFSLFDDLQEMRIANPKLLSAATQTNFQPINELDSSISKESTSCQHTVITEITYPKYWKGLDLPINEYGVIDPTIGEFPSIKESLQLTQNIADHYVGEFKIQSVDGELVNRFDLNSTNCKILSFNGSKYVTCQNWQKISSSLHFVSTNCGVSICGIEEEIQCLYPDHLEDYISAYLNSSTICIVEPENILCDMNSFTNYVHTFYKNNLSANTYGEN